MFSTGNKLNFDEIIKKAENVGKNGGFENENSLNAFINENLDGDKASTLKEVLSDSEKVKAILESDAAKALFKKLSGGENK